TERLGRFEVDHQLELGGLLDRKIAWPGTLQNLVDVDRGAANHFVEVRAVRHETARVDKQACLINFGKFLLRGELDDAKALARRQGIGKQHERIRTLLS